MSNPAKWLKMNWVPPLEESGTTPSLPTRKKKATKQYGIEYRMSESYYRRFPRMAKYATDNEWRVFRWYSTAATRDRTLLTLARKDQDFREFRACER